MKPLRFIKLFLFHCALTASSRAKVVLGPVMKINLLLMLFTAATTLGEVKVANEHCLTLPAPHPIP
jgi:hypothetical protein